MKIACVIRSFVDTGHSFPINSRYDAVAAMRAMEKFTRDVGGYAFLYADTFMDRKEFEEMFDLTGTFIKGPFK